MNQIITYHNNHKNLRSLSSPALSPDSTGFFYHWLYPLPVINHHQLKKLIKQNNYQLNNP